MCSGNQEIRMDSRNGNGGMFQGSNNSKNHTPKRDDEHSRAFHMRVPPKRKLRGNFSHQVPHTLEERGRD